MLLERKVTAAYLVVVLIWSTTPLSIAWSSETIDPLVAVFLRMFIASMIGLLMLKLMHIQLPLNKQALKLYGYSTIGVSGGMGFAYLSSRHISSGLLSVVFGLAPILSGLLSQKILKSPPFSKVKWLGLVICLFGLGIVFKDTLSDNNNSVLGLILVLIAVSFFSLSGVMVKTMVIPIHPLATTVGAVTLSLPLFLLAWLISGAPLAINEWQNKSIYAVLYLGIFGSLIGFICYYFILQKLQPATVALITLITPAVALTLGVYLNNEQLTASLALGSLAIISGLACFIKGR
ncbi:DMT family transporter [Gayadomonas joobiniege]|uniref:DMT family transporter n=1 Tax=Gayadomonas joobiniege TaxID=1234606 RepID=UPI000376B43D|nr:EamA family transporter [Gayadomonas joobiniege]